MTGPLRGAGRGRAGPVDAPIGPGGGAGPLVSLMAGYHSTRRGGLACPGQQGMRAELEGTDGAGLGWAASGGH